MSKTVLVFSKTKEEASKYADEYLKKFFTAQEEIEFVPREYIHGSEGLILEDEYYIAIDQRSGIKPVSDCVDNLRRASVIRGLILEVIFIDFYLVVDPIKRAQEHVSYREQVDKMNTSQGKRGL